MCTIFAGEKSEKYQFGSNNYTPVVPGGPHFFNPGWQNANMPEFKRHQKNPKTDHLSPSRIVNMSERADVEAVIRSVSPRDNYFDGELSDGEAIIRFYGFDQEQAQRLKVLCDKQQPCLL